MTSLDRLEGGYELLERMEDMFILRHEDKPAAWIGDRRVSLAPWVLDRDPADALRRWIVCRAFFVLELQEGALTGQYSDARADHFARSALMPDDEFLQLGARDDEVIAERFGVPVQQVGAKRMDIEAHVARDAAARAD